MEIAEMTAAQRLKRRAWTGALLRSLGHAPWATEQTLTGINFLGGVQRQRLWDQIGNFSTGGFLAHRNANESEGEPELLHPPLYPPALNSINK